MKHMASNFAKLDKFEGVDFRRWQKKMHFLLSSMSVVYMLTTSMPEDEGDNPTVEQVRKRAKWDNDDYVCRGLILNGMSDSLFDIYQNVESSKELPVMEQYNEFLNILGRFTQHKMNIDETIQVFCIIDKLPPSWKDFKHTLKHLNEELTLVELDSYLRIEESIRVYNDNKGERKHHDNTKADPNMKPKDDDVSWWVDSGATIYVCKDRCWFKTYESLNDGSILHMGNESTALVHGHGCVDLKFSSGKIVSLLNVLHAPNIRIWLNIVNDNIGSVFMSTSKLNDSIMWHARLGHVHFKRMHDMPKDSIQECCCEDKLNGDINLEAKTKIIEDC
ncbi:zinc finger, CCHC-type containing protein [Tanacetum coccineum]